MKFGIPFTDTKLHGEHKFGCGRERRLYTTVVQPHALPSRASLLIRRECKSDLASCEHTMTSSGGG